MLSFNPDPLDFDTVGVGDSLAITIFARNDGVSSIDIDSVLFIAVTPEFDVVPVDSSGILAEDSAGFTVTFKPLADSTYADSLFFITNLNDTLKINVFGVGIAQPNIRLNPVALDFDTVRIGPPDSLFVWVVNDSGGVLNIDSTLSTPEFNVSPFNTFGITAGDSALFTVTFQASMESLYVDSIAFFNNDTLNNPLFLNVQGVSVTPQIAFNPVTLTFDSTELTVTDTQLLYVLNVGSDSLHVTNITSQNDFSTNVVSLPAIAPGDSDSVIVVFGPTSIGTAIDSIIFDSDDFFNPVASVIVNAEGLPPKPVFVLLTDSLTFDSTSVLRSDSLTIFVRNDGTAILDIDSISVPLGFNSTPSSFPGIVPGDSTAFLMEFSPLVAGTFVDSFIIFSNDSLIPSVPFFVNGEGIAPLIAAPIDTLDFDTVTVGQDSTLLTYLRNDGVGFLDIVGPAVTSAEFSASPTDTSGVAQGDSAFFQITYTPNAVGAVFDSVLFPNNEVPGAQFPIYVKGIGKASPGPTIFVSTVQFDFDTVIVGASDTLIAQVSNVGIDTLTISSITTPGELSVTPTSFDLIANADTSITVTFTPSAAGVYSDSIVFNSNDSLKLTFAVPVIGERILQQIMTVSVDSIDFDSTNIGVPSQRQFTIFNTGSANLNVSSITTPANVTISLDSAVIAPAGNQVFTLTYSPIALGPFVDNVTINSDDPELPVFLIAAKGLGGPALLPDIDIQPLPFLFPGSNVGVPVSKQLTIQNAGNIPLAVSNIQSSDSHFTVSDTAFASIAPGNSALVDINFTADATGAFSGVITFTSDDPDESPFGFTMNASGIAPVIELSVASLDFDSVAVDFSDSLAFTILNSGSDTLFIESFSVSGCSIAGQFVFNPATVAIAPSADTDVVIRIDGLTLNDLGTFSLSIDIQTQELGIVSIPLDIVVVPPPIPEISIEPLALEFGPVLVGETFTQNIVVTNEGELTLTVDSVTSSAGFNEFYLALDTTLISGTAYIDFEVQPGSSLNLPIIFAPLFEAFRSTEFTLMTNDPLHPVVALQLSGSGILPDVTPPFFTEIPSPFGIDTSSVTISFETDEKTRAVLLYAIEEEFENIALRDSIVVLSFRFAHTIEILGLESNTDYKYIVSVFDSLGNGPAESQVSQFKTLDAPDVQPPFITVGPNIDVIDTSEIIVSWTTNEPSRSIIEWFNAEQFATVDNGLFDDPPLGLEIFDIEDSPLVVNHEFRIDSLDANTRYALRVGSVDDNNNGPTFSFPQLFKTPERPDTEPPLITLQPELLSVDTNRAVISFETNEVSNTFVFFNIDSLFDKQLFLLSKDTAFVKVHQTPLNGLRSDTRYKYFVQTFDAKQNGPTTSGIFDFETLDKPDVLPPIFTLLPTVVESDTDFVTIQWFTNEISTSVVEYEVPVRFDLTRIPVGAISFSKEHNVTLTGLNSNTEYNYIVRSADENGNEAVSARVFSFRTAEIVDIIPPGFLRFPFAFERDTNRVTINWETDEQTTGTIEIVNGETLFDNDLKKLHSVLVDGLIPDSVYKYRVSAIDGKNNGPVFSPLDSFKTLTVPDVLPPVIFGFPGVTIFDTATVKIFWFTSEPSNSRVEFYSVDEDSNDVNTREEQLLRTDNQVTLSGLKPGTEYRYSIASTDGKDNGPAVKEGFVFFTPDRPDLSPPVFTDFLEILDADTTSFLLGWETNEESNAGVEYFEINVAEDTFAVDDQNYTLVHEVFIGGLKPDTDYSVRALSFDIAGNGPVISPWFIIRTLDVPDITPPKLLGFVSVAEIDTNGATITATTDEQAIMEVEFGASTTWPNSTETVTSLDHSFDHEVILTDLDSFEYTFQARFQDRSGNTSLYSQSGIFKTLEKPDSTAPVILGFVDIASIDTSQATFQWFTDEQSTSIIELALESEWPENKITIVKQQLVDEHELVVRELLSNTRYTGRAGSIDGKGNGPGFSDEFSFKTFSVVTIREQNDTTEASTSLDGALVEEHAVFINGLDSDTEYEYTVSSTDANNNGPVSKGWFLFKTLEIADETQPAVVFGPIIIGLTHHAATIKLKTDEESFVFAEYGIDSTLGSLQAENNGKTTHNIQLMNLSDSTLYFYRIGGFDSKGNDFRFPPSGQEPLTFTTRPIPAVDDISQPIITAGPVELGIDTDKLSVFWSTNVLANSTVDYGLDTLISNRISQDNAIPVNNHTVQLQDLFADTTYYYRFRSRGENNSEVVSQLFFVNTLAQPDTFPPQINAGPHTPFLTPTSATVEWTTDKNSSSGTVLGLQSIDVNATGAVLGTLYDRQERDNEIDQVLAHQIKFSDLLSDTTYFYRVFSTAENGKEVVSEEFSFITPALPDILAPQIIAGPDPTNIESRSATIEWRTDELSTSKIEFGERQQAGFIQYTETRWVDADAAGVADHKAILTGLNPNTVYDFRVTSADFSPLINEVVSRNKRFTTTAFKDSIAPVLKSGPIVDKTDKTAIFEWDTDEASDSFIFIKFKDSDENFRKIGDDRKVTKHIVTVTNLIVGAIYEFELASRDLAGNLMTWPTQANTNNINKVLALRKESQVPGGFGVFFTNQFPDTNMPIIIEGPTVVQKTSETITVQWNTDERSDSFIEYGYDESYDSLKGEISDLTSHRITLTNLDPGTVYDFRVMSTDPSNNGPSLSGNAAVSTEMEADESPPEITIGPVITAITNDQATILWETDEPADTRLEFGFTSDYEKVLLSTEDNTFHFVTMTNLLPDTLYHLRVLSTDISDNGPIASVDTTFRTAAGPDFIPPLIDSIRVAAISDKSATIIFITDELGDSFVEFGFTSDSLSNTKGSAEDVTEHKLTLTNLMPDTTYHFGIGSIDKSGNENAVSALKSGLRKMSAPAQFSFETLTGPDTDAPVSPQGIDGVEGNNQALIRWSPNSEDDLGGYNLYKRENSDPFQLIETLLSDTFYYDNNVSNSSVYWYKVTAADQVIPFNESDASDLVSINPMSQLSVSVPGAVTPVNNEIIRNDEIVVKVDNVSLPLTRTGSATYDIVIIEEQDFFNQVVSGVKIPAGDTETTWIPGVTLNHNQTYFWKVRAFDGFFYSDWSSANSFVTDATAPTSVQLVNFWGKVENGAVKLEWLTALEIFNAGFNIYRGQTLYGAFIKLNEQLLTGGENSYQFRDLSVEAGREYFYRLEAVSLGGNADIFESIRIEVLQPRTFKLYQNYPNPFNPETTIKFDLPKTDQVRIVIYNILGQEIRALLNEPYNAGFHEVVWNGRDTYGRPVASGVYFYRVNTGQFSATKKMLLLK